MGNSDNTSLVSVSQDSHGREQPNNRINKLGDELDKVVDVRGDMRAARARLCQDLKTSSFDADMIKRSINMLLAEVSGDESQVNCRKATISIA